MSRPTLLVDYFDGRHARPQRLEARVAADQLDLILPAGETLRSIPVRQVQWPERTRHGARIAQLPDGAALHALDSAAWDDWARASGLQDSWTVRLQQSWRWTLLAAAGLTLVSIWAYRWGLPLAATGVLAITPTSIDTQLGQAALNSLEGRWLHPSRLAVSEQQRVRRLFDRALAADGAQPPTAHVLLFRRSTIGPNAFALPDGTIVVTDELVSLLQGQDAALIGVLGHELGHVRHRHGMRLFVQSGILGTAASVVWGDFSSIIATAPALLGHLAYSRDFEREADDDAIALLRANGLKPSSMVLLFEKLEAHRQDGTPPDGDQDSEAPDMGIAFSSHPPDAERIRRLKEADEAPPP